MRPDLGADAAATASRPTAGRALERSVAGGASVVVAGEGDGVLAERVHLPRHTGGRAGSRARCEWSRGVVGAAANLSAVPGGTTPACTGGVPGSTGPGSRRGDITPTTGDSARMPWASVCTRVQPPSCTHQWWWRQRSTRLAVSV